MQYRTLKHMDITCEEAHELMKGDIIALLKLFKDARAKKTLYIQIIHRHELRSYKTLYVNKKYVL